MAGQKVGKRARGEGEEADGKHSRAHTPEKKGGARSASANAPALAAPARLNAGARVRAPTSNNPTDPGRPAPPDPNPVLDARRRRGGRRAGTARARGRRPHGARPRPGRPRPPRPPVLPPVPVPAGRCGGDEVRERKRWREGSKREAAGVQGGPFFFLPRPHLVSLHPNPLSSTGRPTTPPPPSPPAFWPWRATGCPPGSSPPARPRRRPGRRSALKCR